MVFRVSKEMVFREKQRQARRGSRRVGVSAGRASARVSLNSLQSSPGPVRACLLLSKSGGLLLYYYITRYICHSSLGVSSASNRLIKSSSALYIDIPRVAPRLRTTPRLPRRSIGPHACPQSSLHRWRVFKTGHILRMMLQGHR